MAAAVPAREVVETTINGTVYKIEKLPGKAGALMGLRLSRVIGPALEADEVLEKLFAKLTEAELTHVLDTFAKSTRFSPEENPEAEFFLTQKFDEHFSGNYGTMVLWLKACLETNYGSFLGAFGVTPEQLKKLLGEMMGQAMKSESTGSSGLLSKLGGAPSAK